MTLDPQPLAPALAAAEAAGWTTLRLDLDGVRGKAELMARCGDALRLPDWFGGNWDALADAVRDLSWLPVPVPRGAEGAGAAGRLVVVTSWRRFAEARPEDWEILVEILEEAVAFWREREREDGAPRLAVLLAEAEAEGEAESESGAGPAAAGRPRATRPCSGPRRRRTPRARRGRTG
ncbi:barstar family protein, partial [Streptomyces sp. NPDC046685]|uniref:barstar family protein n=1 Tax=Streptomyces sp. NPDC046685 TaxID=3157202 RepID=UPI0033F8E145